MKKETIAKLSALSLATMLLTSCMGNKPAETTISTSNTEPSTSVSDITSAPSTSQTTEPVQPACTCEPTIEKHIDFDFPNPLDFRKIYNVISEQKMRNFSYCAIYNDSINNAVIHKFNTIFQTDKDNNLRMILGCGIDNDNMDNFSNTYVDYNNSHFYIFCDQPFQQISNTDYYFCDKCFDEQKDKDQFFDVVNSSDTPYNGDKIQYYKDFKMESEINK